MGQKLERLSEKDEESLDNSDWSEQTAETQHSEITEQDETRDQDDGCFAIPESVGISGISVSDRATGHTGERTVTPAHTDVQTGKPIRPLGQIEHPLYTRGERVGGDRQSGSVAQTVVESKTVLRPRETRQTLNKKQGSVRKAVAFSWTTAMEKKGNGEKTESCPENQTRGVTATCNPTNEEDFVVLERDESWISSDGENNRLGNRIKTDTLQTSIKTRAEEDTLNICRDDCPSQPSRNTCEEKAYENKSRRTSDTHSVTADTVVARAKTSSNAYNESEVGQHLAEVTGSRCQLKGGSGVGVGHTETTGRGKAERERSLNGHSEQQVSTHANKEHRSIQNNSSKDLENVEEEVAKSYENRFAGVVSKRAKAGTLGSFSKKGEGAAFDKAADSQSPKSKPPSSEMPPLQDNPSFSLEQCDLITCSSLPGSAKKEIASLKKESELVCFSAVVSPPPLTHLMPKKENTTTERQLDKDMTSSQVMPDDTTAPRDPKDESVSKEKSKVKGPPPPVPKKPKNPFIKLKTAQLMSTDVQRRVKDTKHSEEKVKRRHTFHFNKDLPKSPTNQDMCVLLDDRGTFVMPANIRRLSVDLSPWQHLSLRHMDDQYGDMIDYDYCMRMANLSPDEDPENLDMLQRRVFLERRSRYKGSPPHVQKKSQNPFPSTESLDIPEVMSEKEILRPKPACSRRREISPDRPSERVSSDNHANYGYRRDVADNSSDRDAASVDSYKPVSEIIREKNEMQRHQSRVKPEGPKAQVRVAEQSPSVKVSQMKNTFDVPKKSKERPQEVQPPPKKGKNLGLSELEDIN